MGVSDTDISSGKNPTLDFTPTLDLKSSVHLINQVREFLKSSVEIKCIKNDFSHLILIHLINQV